MRSDIDRNENPSLLDGRAYRLSAHFFGCFNNRRLIIINRASSASPLVRSSRFVAARSQDARSSSDILTSFVFVYFYFKCFSIFQKCEFITRATTIYPQVVCVSNNICAKSYFRIVFTKLQRMGSSRRYRFLFQPVGVPRAIFFPLANVKRLRRRRSSTRKSRTFSKTRRHRTLSLFPKKLCRLL